MKLSQRQQQGLTLIELLIALVIGSLISAAAMQMLLTNKRTLTTQQGNNEVEENGRYAIDFLMRDIRKAGMRPTTATTPIATPIVAVNGATNTGDQITITYSLDSANSNAPPTDCNGNTLSGVNPTITNQYYVDNSGRLMCLGNGSVTPGEIVDGVDAFQILYGIDNVTDANLVVTQWTSAPASNATVVAVRIGLMVHSDTRFTDLPTPAADVDVLGQITLAATSSTLNDGHIHRLFVSSTLLRNNLDPDVTTF